MTQIETIETLQQYYREHDPLLYYSLATLREMKGNRIDLYAHELLEFINQHYHHVDVAACYSERVRQLVVLQRDFVRTGHYQAARYGDVHMQADRETYNLALLMSFFTTVHRFEILEELVRFLSMPVTATNSLLSVGVGTGYEIKLAYDHLSKDWHMLAYDSSDEAISYAQELLQHFRCPTNSLQPGFFPLENDEGLARYSNSFGKVIACELLEHLENPRQALENLRTVLHPNGHLFVTMAIQIAQEDHIYLYKTAQQARDQIIDAGFRIERDLLAPISGLPFTEEERVGQFEKGNYIAIVTK